MAIKDVKEFSFTFIMKNVPEILQSLDLGNLIYFKRSKKRYYLISEGVLKDLLDQAGMELQDG